MGRTSISEEGHVPVVSASPVLLLGHFHVSNSVQFLQRALNLLSARVVIDFLCDFA